MSSRAQDVRKFLRAVKQRLGAAQFLFENGFHLDSIYLGGYSVECALKALILDRTPSNVYAAMYDSITRGIVGHSFAYLRGKLMRPPINCTIPPEIIGAIHGVSSWTTQLRYETGLVREREARRFLVAVRSVKEWVERSLS